MRFIFVGDIALGDHPKAVGFGFYSKYRNGISPAKASNLFPQHLEADIVFGNLEFSIDSPCVKGDTIKELCCKGVETYIPFLQGAGFNVLNVANNHMFQHGPDSFISTVEKLEVAGFKVCGLPEDFESPAVIAPGGQSVALLGWCARPRQYFNDKPAYNELLEPDCYRRIEEARTRAAVVCSSVHWGDEFIQLPAQREREIARRMIDHGASIVIGHHPHVVREIEEYRGGLIAYSLGNFIGDMTWNSATRRTGCLFVEMSGRQTIKGWQFYPALIDSDYFPRYERGDSATAVIKDLERRYQAAEMLQRLLQYRGASRAYMLQNQLLTLLFVMKNRRKYGPAILKEMIMSGIMNRLSKNGNISSAGDDRKAGRDSAV
jgi:poly-gamma-glutamate synthesis protein (capsule biosynthesis protein)